MAGGRNLGRGRGASLVASVLGLLLLASVAFLLGALAGLVWKEPDLLMAYWSGETTEVAWSEGEGALPESPEAPVVAASAENTNGPAAAVAAAPAPARAPAPAPAAAPAVRPPAVAAAPPPAVPPARIAVQVGAFGERGAAERLRADLQSDGFPAYVMAAAGPRWRVRVGPYPSREKAEGVAARLKRSRRLPTWVLDEDAE